MLPRFAQSLCVTREANRDLRHKTDQRNCAGRHPGMDRRSQTQWPRLLRQVHHHAGRKYGDHYQLLHPSLKQWLGRRIEQQDQSAQAPLLRDRQSDQSLPPHLVGSKRLRSFCTLMAQDIGGLHGNSQRTKILNELDASRGVFDVTTVLKSYLVDIYTILRFRNITSIRSFELFDKRTFDEKELIHNLTNQKK